MLGLPLTLPLFSSPLLSPALLLALPCTVPVAPATFDTVSTPLYILLRLPLRLVVPLTTAIALSRNAVGTPRAAPLDEFDRWNGKSLPTPITDRFAPRPSPCFASSALVSTLDAPPQRVCTCYKNKQTAGLVDAARSTAGLTRPAFTGQPQINQTLKQSCHRPSDTQRQLATMHYSNVVLPLLTLTAAGVAAAPGANHQPRDAHKAHAAARREHVRVVKEREAAAGQLQAPRSGKKGKRLVKKKRGTCQVAQGVNSTSSSSVAESTASSTTAIGGNEWANPTSVSSTTTTSSAAASSTSATSTSSSDWTLVSKVVSHPSIIPP